MTFWIILLLVGALFAVVGRIWLIVVSFMTSIVWGLCVLFVPFTELFFLFLHWETARRPFFCMLFGIGLFLPAVLINQKDIAEQVAHARGERAETPAPEQRPESPLQKQERIERQRAAFVQHAAELKAKYDTLQAQWAKLKPDDKAGRAVFDQEAATYQAMRKQVEIEKAEVEAPAPAH